MLKFPDVVCSNAGSALIDQINEAKLPLCCDCIIPRKSKFGLQWKVIKTEEQYAMCRIAGHVLWLPYWNKEWWQSTCQKGHIVGKWEWSKGGN